jgi:hypothetical protein
MSLVDAPHPFSQQQVVMIGGHIRIVPATLVAIIGLTLRDIWLVVLSENSQGAFMSRLAKLHHEERGGSP